MHTNEWAIVSIVQMKILVYQTYKSSKGNPFTYLYAVNKIKEKENCIVSN